MLVLAVAATALAGPDGTKYGIHTIRGMNYDRAALEKLLDDSDAPAEVKAYAWGIKEVKGKFRLDKNKPVEEAVLDFIDRHRHAFKLKNPKRELNITRKEDHKEGDIHVRYSQTYDGIPVWGKELIVHINKKHQLDRIIADNVPTPNIDTTSLVTEEEAVEIAKEDIGKIPGDTAIFRVKELVIYHGKLAYRFLILYRANSWDYFVDAKTGKIIFKGNRTVYEGT